MSAWRQPQSHTRHNKINIALVRLWFSFQNKYYPSHYISYVKINLSLMDSWTAFCRLPSSTTSNLKVFCVHVNTFVCVYLNGFACRYIHVWVNANGRPAQPGIKTVIQTDWGSGSESAMSKHKLAQSVESEERS